jgi:hypothetical protein
MCRPIGSAVAIANAVMLLASCGGGGGPTGPSGPPVVTLVNGATVPSAPIGATVVIQGSNFGSGQAAASGQVLFTNGTGGPDTALIASAGDWSNTLIVTTVPAGAATGNLVVKTSGGPSTPVVFTVAAKVAFSPSAVSWTSTTALPVGLSGHAVAAATLSGPTATSVVYVIGGADNTNTPRNGVLYATVSSSGAVGSWSTTAGLPAPVAFAAAVVVSPANAPVTNTYLVVLGGDSAASGKPVATVYLGALGTTGAVTGWSTTTALPAPVHSLGAVVFNGSVYIAGGSGPGNTPVATVYRAAIKSDGTLGAWGALTSLPFARSYFGFGVNGTFLYAFGGDSSSVTPNDSSSLKTSSLSDVVYAQIDVHAGNLTAAGWTLNTTKLKKPVAKHTAVVAGGNALITAGLYNGATTGSSEESYAGLNADGSTGTFNGATGVNTIKNAGGGNVFNHAATGYLDASGAFHVLVVGGDDVNAPTITKHAGVFYY